MKLWRKGDKTGKGQGEKACVHQATTHQGPDTSVVARDQQYLPHSNQWWWLIGDSGRDRQDTVLKPEYPQLRGDFSSRAHSPTCPSLDFWQWFPMRGQWGSFTTQKELNSWLLWIQKCKYVQQFSLDPLKLLATYSSYPILVEQIDWAKKCLRHSKICTHIVAKNQQSLNMHLTTCKVLSHTTIYFSPKLWDDFPGLAHWSQWVC